MNKLKAIKVQDIHGNNALICIDSIDAIFEKPKGEDYSVRQACTIIQVNSKAFYVEQTVDEVQQLIIDFFDNADAEFEAERESDIVSEIKEDIANSVYNNPYANAGIDSYSDEPIRKPIPIETVLKDGVPWYSSINNKFVKKCDKCSYYYDARDGKECDCESKEPDYTAENLIKGLNNLNKNGAEVCAKVDELIKLNDKPIYNKKEVDNFLKKLTKKICTLPKNNDGSYKWVAPTKENKPVSDKMDSILSISKCNLLNKCNICGRDIDNANETVYYNEQTNIAKCEDCYNISVDQFYSNKGDKNNG